MEALGVAAVVAAAALIFAPYHSHFVPEACASIEPHVLSEVVGQELAVHQMADAICDHLNKQNADRPLVLSVHGPPGKLRSPLRLPLAQPLLENGVHTSSDSAGVGKSMSHALLAQALYLGRPDSDVHCRGGHCLGYKVLQGMDHINAEREKQHWYLKNAILEHVNMHPEALLVIEEYDKLDCPTRAVLRQFITAPASVNASLGKAVILLESNIGQSQLHQMLVQAGDRSKVTPEQAHNSLRNLVYNVWSQSNCDSHIDIIKLLGAINFFLPYFPLGYDNLHSLFEKRLEAQADQLMESHSVSLSWNTDVVKFLLSKVDFGDCSPRSFGCYPVEGARPVNTIMTRYVSRAIKNWSYNQTSAKQLQKARDKAVNPGWRGSIARKAEQMKKKFQPTVVHNAHLAVGPDMRTLVVR